MKRSKFIRHSGAFAGTFFVSPQSFFLNNNHNVRLPQSNGNSNSTKLKDVNTTDIEVAIRLGINAVLNCFDADDNDIPFFFAWARPDPNLSFHRLFSEACVPGAKLEGILSAGQTLNIPLEPDVIQKLTKALYFSFSGPIALPLNRQKEKGRLANFETANLCENLSGMVALVRYHKSEKAQVIVEQCIDAISEYWNPESGWDAKRMKERHGINCSHFFKDYDAKNKIPFITSSGRALGALALYYEATRSAKALKLILQLKDIATTEYFTANGDYDPIRMGTYSSGITWMLLSLARTASVLNDESLMNRVKKFYDNGLNLISNSLGWSPEPLEHFNGDTDGAMNAGRVLETSIILGKAGHITGYQRSEQILRARLLPSQLRDISWIPPIENQNGLDEYRNVATRIQGSWGFPSPYGLIPKKDEIFGEYVLFAQDIVGDVMTSLSEAYRQVTEYDGKEYKVNLLFDHKTDDIEVKSPYTNDSLRILPKRPGNILIRFPVWVKTDELKVGGGKILNSSEPGYLYVRPNDKEVVVSFPLKMRDIELSYKNEKIRVRLKGDQVVQMENFGADLTFFDPY